MASEIPADISVSKGSGRRSHRRLKAVILGLIFMVAGGAYSVWNVSAFSPVRNLVPFTRTTAPRLTKQEAIWAKQHLPRLASDAKAIRAANAAANQAFPKLASDAKATAYLDPTTFPPLSVVMVLDGACQRYQKDISSDEGTFKQAAPSLSNADITKIFSSEVTLETQCTTNVALDTYTPMPPARNPCYAGYVYDYSSNSCYPDQQMMQRGAIIFGQMQQQEQAFAAQEAASAAAQAAQRAANLGVPPLP